MINVDANSIHSLLACSCTVSIGWVVEGSPRLALHSLLKVAAISLHTFRYRILVVDALFKVALRGRWAEVGSMLGVPVLRANSKLEHTVLIPTASTSSCSYTVDSTANIKVLQLEME